MNKTQEALKMAVEALEESMPLVFGNGIALEMMKTPLLEVEQKVNFHKKAINACKEALAEAEKQEPVALKFPTMLRKMWSGGEVQEWLDKQQPLYTHPATWQSLSDDEIELLALDNDVVSVISQVEAKLKEKNHEQSDKSV